jgi:predicted GIY-YIG superfamily endonuclease
MGGAPDHQRLVTEVLGIKGASPELARRLVAQALVVEDRREAWLRAGERICQDAPSLPGVYVLQDAMGRVLYVGKATNLRRRLRAHFAERRWRYLKPEMSRAEQAEWHVVGSELEALLREAALIDELKPVVNVQTGLPDLNSREVPRPLVRDVIVILASAEPDSVELIAARPTGSWMLQRSRRDGSDLVVHAQRLMRFFHSVLSSGRSRRVPLRAGSGRDRSDGGPAGQSLAPLVYSWLARRGADATRLDPRDVRDARELRARLSALLRDERLFHERLDQRDSSDA